MPISVPVALYRLAIAQGKRPETSDPSLTQFLPLPQNQVDRWWVVLFAVLRHRSLVVFVLVPFDLPAGASTWNRLLDRFFQMLYLWGRPSPVCSLAAFAPTRTPNVWTLERCARCTHHRSRKFCGCTWCSIFPSPGTSSVFSASWPALSYCRMSSSGLGTSLPESVDTSMAAAWKKWAVPSLCLNPFEIADLVAWQPAELGRAWSAAYLPRPRGRHGGGNG